MADEPTNPQQQLPLETPPDSKAEIAALKAEIGRTNQSMDQRLAQMQAMMQQGRAPVAPSGNPNKDLNERLWDALQNNPSELLTAQQAMMQRQLAAYDQQNRASRFQSDKVIARNTVREDSEYKEVFDRFGSDVEAYIGKVWPNSPDAFVNVDVWRTAADAVRGQKWKELSGSRGADPGAPGKPSTKPMPSNKSKDDEPLSDAEALAADEVFGIDHDTYRKHKKIDKDQRDMRTALGRSMLQSPLAKMTYVDKRTHIDGMRNPFYGMERPYMTFDSQRQKPRHPRGKEA